MSSKLFRPLAFAAAFTLAAVSLSQAQVYMVAHQDDWPLFMGHKAFEDISTNKPCVFIYTTAGEAGMKTGGWGSIPYFRAREEAAMHGLRLPSNLIEQWFPSDVTSRIKINNRNITVMTHRNTTSYFIRLQDGKVSGEGYDDNRNQSLKRLRLGLVSPLTAIDNSASYARWSDMVNTVKAILARHGTGATINTHDFNEVFNPDDHSDHFETGRLARDAAIGTASKMRYWLGYESASHEPNLNTEQIQEKYGVYGAHIATMSRYGYNIGWDYGHRAYLTRGIFRESTP